MKRFVNTYLRMFTNNNLADRVVDLNFKVHLTNVYETATPLLVKGSAQTRMKVTGGKITVKTSATFGVGRLTKCKR